MKVYCKGCKYIKIDEGTLCEERCDYICVHESNVSYRDKSNWYDKNEKVEVYTDVPVNLNKHNTCYWYERKE